MIYHTKKYIRLFNLLPLIVVKENDNYSYLLLFGSIPIFSIKKKMDYSRYNHALFPQLGPKVYCGGKTILSANTYCEEPCSFNGCEVHGGGKVFIGKHFHSGVNLLIIAQNHNYDTGKHIPYSPNDFAYKDIRIGDFVWVGSNVTILPGTQIGEGAIIQAGSVVHGEIPPCAIAGGNPIQVFKYRDKKHFEKLKKEKKFN